MVSSNHEGQSAPEELSKRLDRLQSLMEAIEVRLSTLQLPQKEAFTPAEFGELAGLSPYTVRDHIKHGRLCATRALSGRGTKLGWRLSRAELGRYQREGLLPPSGLARALKLTQAPTLTENSL